MTLMEDLIFVYLHHSNEYSHFLDVETMETIMDASDFETGVPGIDWEDEQSEERYIPIPTSDSDTGYKVMEDFAYQTKSDRKGKLADALKGHKPFRSFKDALYELDLWDEWNAFEEKCAEKAIHEWLQEENLDYSTLNEKYISLHP